MEIFEVDRNQWKRVDQGSLAISTTSTEVDSDITGKVDVPVNA
jgi:hypothetical protein